MTSAMKRTCTTLDHGYSEDPIAADFAASSAECSPFSFTEKQQFLQSSQQQQKYNQQYHQQRKKPATNVDKLLATEMNQLTLAEREHVFEEVHGVAQVIQETPEFVEEHMVLLEAEIIKIKNKTAYDRAMFLAPRQVTSFPFRLAFLRSEYFEPSKAAKRMVLYFQCKLDTFGLDKLCQPITFADLDEDAQVELMTGCAQVLPTSKDRAGRRVFVDCALAFCDPNTSSKSVRNLYVRFLTRLFLT
jgi:hypothetical protein